MQKKLFLCMLLMSISSIVLAQCPTASYNLADSVCAGTPFTVTGTTVGSSSYKWDFCSGDIWKTPVAQPDYAGVSTALGNDLALDSGNYYAFTSYTAGISRYEYGNSLLNVPVHTNLGNIGGLMSSTGDIKIVNDNGNWYGLVCHWDSRITKLSFGNSLSNMPTITQLAIAPGMLGKPYNITVVKDGEDFVALTANQDSVSVSTINFGSSLENDTPAVASVPVVAGSLVGIAAMKDCDNWVVFATSLDAVGIARIEFGNSLSNAPLSVSNFNATGDASGTWNFNLVRENGRFVGLGNGLTVLKRFDFGTSLSNIPVYSATPAYTGTNLARGLTVKKFGSNYFGAGTDYFIGTRIISYPNDCFASPSSADSLAPIQLSYSEPGWHYIHLDVVDSAGNSDQITDSIFVLATPLNGYSTDKSCLNEPVQFNDSSTASGASIIDWSWDFGDGSSSDLQHPVHIYNTPGSYQITLTTLSSSGCSSTSVDTLVVNIPPTANFVFPDSICGNSAVGFIDSSLSITGNIVEWGWLFGDSTFSTIQNPVHTYDSSGVFTVQLYVIDDGGCQHDTSKALVSLAAARSAFSVDNTCINSATQFTNLTDSNFSAVSNYYWDFDDGTTASTPNPSHMYSSPSAQYSVMLVAHSTNGCTDTITEQVTVSEKAIPDFQTSRDSACTSNPIIFTSTAMAMPGDSIIRYHWDFGDGNSSDQPVISHSFTAPGIYTVRHTVSTPFSCDSSIVKDILVSPSPDADFTYTQVCEGSATVFNDLSVPLGAVPINSWHWQFGDSLTDSIQNPVHVYATAGTYNALLMVVDELGCSDTMAQQIEVFGIPTAMFSYSNACTDTLTSFTDLSTVVNGTINSWSWDFGDGNTSDWKNPLHEFDPAGTYVVDLIVETVEGCADTTFQAVEIFQAPEGNFNASLTCEGDITAFNFISSITPSPVTSWFWQFGDGGISTIKDPAHFYLNAGTFDVSLSIEDSSTGCSSVIKKSVTVNSIPEADFSFGGNCENTLISFSNLSTVASGNITQWLWRFGDTDTSMLQNPGHIYGDDSTYQVTLIVSTPEGCIDSVMYNIEIDPTPVAGFSLTPSFGSPPLQVNFNNTSTGATSYLWNFGDGNNSTSENPQNFYDDLGLYFPQLIAISAEGCSDTISSVVNVLDPDVNIAVMDIYHSSSGNVHNISALLINLGNVEINTFEISAQLQSNALLHETWNGLLLPNQTLLYEFSSSAIIWNEDPDFYCVEVQLIPQESDRSPSDNKLCKSFDAGFNILQVFPNPFQDFFNLLLQAPEDGRVFVDIYSANGKKLLADLEIPVASGVNDKLIDARTFGSGLYYLRVRMNDEERSIAVFKN